MAIYHRVTFSMRSYSTQYFKRCLEVVAHIKIVFIFCSVLKKTTTRSYLNCVVVQYSISYAYRIRRII